MTSFICDGKEEVSPIILFALGTLERANPCESEIGEVVRGPFLGDEMKPEILVVDLPNARRGSERVVQGSTWINWSTNGHARSTAAQYRLHGAGSTTGSATGPFERKKSYRTHSYLESIVQ
jgi:hypothetical protein